MAVGQLEVKTDLLNYIIAIVLITVGLAAALALGLGSRGSPGRSLQESTSASCIRSDNR